MPQTYSAHIGPAAAVLAGGTPLVDVQSQYGVLSYLVYAAALGSVFVPSYYGALAVTSSLNFLGLAIVIAVAWKFAKNRLTVLVIATAAMLVMPWLVNAVPAHGGPRFLPPLFLLLALSRLRAGRTDNLSVLAAIVLCSWWSLEVFLWTMATYLVFLTAFCVERRGGIGQAASSALKAVCAAAGTHFLYGAVTRLFFGTWPRYDHYFSYISGNLGASWAYVEPELSNPIWMMPIGTCLVAIAFGAHRAFLMSNFSKAVQRQPMSACIGLRALDAINLVKKYEPTRKKALFFLPGAEDLSIALFSGHRHRLDISSPLGLEYSRVLTVDAMAKINSDLQPGEAFITSTKLLDVANLDPTRMKGQKIADHTLYTAHFAKAIFNRFEGCELERTSTGVVAMRLMNKNGALACQGIGPPFQYELVRYID